MLLLEIVCKRVGWAAELHVAGQLPGSRLTRHVPASTHASGKPVYQDLDHTREGPKKDWAITIEAVALLRGYTSPVSMSCSGRHFLAQDSRSMVFAVVQ